MEISIVYWNCREVRVLTIFQYINKISNKLLDGLNMRKFNSTDMYSIYFTKIKMIYNLCDIFLRIYSRFTCYILFYYIYLLLLNIFFYFLK
jgi:hypothetical protein